MCPHCKFLDNTFGEILSNREYWLYTEMFVYLHNGADHCIGDKESTGKELTDDEISALG